MKKTSLPVTRLAITRKAISGLVALSATMLGTTAHAASPDQPWTGWSFGGSVGYAWQQGEADERIVFDTNADGVFTDAVRTGAGADAFSPGFCGGAARTNLPASGCVGDRNGVSWRLSAGHDWQRGAMVYGVAIEGGHERLEDSVSGYSTTPAAYVMTREIDGAGALRGRIGRVIQPFDALFYVTGGLAYATIENRFATSNTANVFLPNNEHDAWGWVAGLGMEKQVGDRLAVGVTALYTTYDTGDYRVNASRGSAPATNPFVITPAGSTDFARGQPDFEHVAVRLTVSYRR